jgi:hypothetical protein
MKINKKIRRKIKIKLKIFKKTIKIYNFKNNRVHKIKHRLVNKNKLNKPNRGKNLLLSKAKYDNL